MERNTRQLRRFVNVFYMLEVCIIFRVLTRTKLGEIISHMKCPPPPENKNIKRQCLKVLNIEPWGQKDSTVFRALSLHVLDRGLIPSTPYGVLILSGIIHKCRARNKALLGGVKK